MTAEQLAMAAFAVARMGDGRTPGQAFADLVGIGIDHRQAALAVCVALGTDRATAEQRVREYDSLWPLLEPGEDEAAGELLADHGFFDVEVELDDAQNATASWLNQAFAAAGGMLATQTTAHFRRIRTGRLREAFLELESLGQRRNVVVPEFWQLLIRAADSFGLSADRDVLLARERCLRRS
jgi:hypothetical protein